MDAGLEQTIMHDPGPARSMITYTFVGKLLQRTEISQRLLDGESTCFATLRIYAIQPRADARRGALPVHSISFASNVQGCLRAERCFLIMTRRGCDVTP
jgi:hypothetical protein